MKAWRRPLLAAAECSIASFAPLRRCSRAIAPPQDSAQEPARRGRRVPGRTPTLRRLRLSEACSRPSVATTCWTLSWSWASSPQDGVELRRLRPSLLERRRSAGADEFQVNTYTSHPSRFTPRRCRRAARRRLRRGVVERVGQDDSNYAHLRPQRVLEPRRRPERARSRSTPTPSGSTNATPSVGVASDGDFVVAWQSYAQDGCATTARSRARFSSAGSRAGRASSRSATTPTNVQQKRLRRPAAPDGSFVHRLRGVRTQDGSDDGIFARRFSSTG